MDKWDDMDLFTFISIVENENKNKKEKIFSPIVAMVSYKKNKKIHMANYNLIRSIIFTLRQLISLNTKDQKEQRFTIFSFKEDFSGFFEKFSSKALMKIGKL